MSQHNNCLLLNADYSPLAILSWQRAITWVCRTHYSEQIQVVEYYNDTVKGANKEHRLPAVIRVRKYFKVVGRYVNFSRKNVYIRDNYTCQYCGIKHHISNLTYDHVVPRSMWTHKSSPTTWTNIVTACVKCNRKKGNKKLDQINMSLIRSPIRPVRNIYYLPVATYLSTIDRIPNEWEIYTGPFIQK